MSVLDDLFRNILYRFLKFSNYYITKEEAEKLYSWSKGKDLFKLAPGKMIGGDIYKNKE